MGLWYRLTCVVLVAALFVSCSSKNKKEAALKPAKLVELKSVLKEKKLWKSRAGKGQDRRYTRFQPALHKNRIYASDVKGNVVAIDKDSGKKVWSVSLKKGISGSLSADHGLVLLGTYEGEVYALDAETGETKWNAKASTEILSPPKTNGSEVVAQTIDSKLFGFKASDGSPLWSFDHVNPVLTYRTTAAPQMTATQVVAGFDNGQVVSLSPSDGSVRWDARVSQPSGSTDLDRISDIDGTPLATGGFVYAGTFQGKVVALSRGQGRPVWSADFSTYQHMTSDQGKIYLSTERSKVVALDSATGAIEWENDKLWMRGIGPPVVVGDYVIVIDKDFYMHVLSQSDGSFLHRFKASGLGKGPLTTLPISDGKRLYVLGNNGALRAYEFTKLADKSKK